MRVIWVTGNFYPQIGGLEVYIDSVTNKLADLCTLAFVTQADQWPPRNPNIEHFRVPNMTRPNGAEEWLDAARGIAACVAEFEPDIIHLSNASVAVYRWALPEWVPVIATVHGNDLTAPWQRVPGSDPTQSIVDGLNGCDHICAVSGHTADLVRRWSVRTPVTVLTAGCDLDFFRPIAGAKEAVCRKYRIPEQVPIILTVGRLVPRKGHLNILNALKEVDAPFHWIISGNGPGREQVIEAIAESGLGGRVTMLGHISEEQLLQLYNACAVFVFAPEERQLNGQIDSEGFGLVFHEAGACGKPVIGTAASGCREAVLHGTTGILTTPGDTRMLALAIREVITNPELASALGREGLAFVRASGGWARLARQMIEIYERVMQPVEQVTEPPDSLMYIE